jgi:ATP synthase F1 delta subunit
MSNPLTRRRLARHVAAELHAGRDRDVLLHKVAAYLVAHNMRSQYELLVRDVLDIFAKEYGVVTADVVSARQLTADTKQQIETFVAKQTSAKEVRLSERVDESLIGGTIIRTPDAEYDSSLRTKLNQLKV